MTLYTEKIEKNSSSALLRELQCSPAASYLEVEPMSWAMRYGT
jgi:hypothetical protein